MVAARKFLPFLHWWPRVDRATWHADAVAAITAAVIVLPQGIAFAGIAGLPPEYGFYTAMVVPIVAALFGSSWHLVSGPTTAISALVFATLVTRFQPASAAFIEAAITMTLLVGVFQVILGALRMGAVANFMSPSVMTGFTAGAALIIALSQLGSALGIELARPEQLGVYVSGLLEGMQRLNLHSAGITLTTVVVAISVKRLAPKWPNYLIGMLCGSLVAVGIDAARHGVLFVGSLPSIIPPFAVPELSLTAIRELSQGAFAIALVGLLEAVAIARTVSEKSGQEIRTNQEFIGQGLSNAVGSFFSAYVGSGSFTRTGVNYEAGARTPLAAILSSVFLFPILLLVANLFTYVPIPAIAGVIMVVAYKLIRFDEIREILATSRTSTTVMLVTFGSTLLIGFEFAIYAGVFTSMVFFLRRSASPYLAMMAPDVASEQRYFLNARAFDLDQCPQVGFARIDGVLFFGSLAGVRARLRNLEETEPEQKHLVVLLKGIGEMDMHGAQLLIEEAHRRRRRGGRLYLTARQRQISTTLRNFRVIDSVGADNVYRNKGAAMQSIVPQLDRDICATCTKRIFIECPPASNQDSVGADDKEGDMRGA